LLTEEIVKQQQGWPGFAAVHLAGALRSLEAQPTDTLVTKVILGTFGRLPAFDRYFADGLKSQGLRYSSLSDESGGSFSTSAERT
jgi:hypothetical protein